MFLQLLANGLVTGAVYAIAAVGVAFESAFRLSKDTEGLV